MTTFRVDETKTWVEGIDAVRDQEMLKWHARETINCGIRGEDKRAL
jgi:hypothetical protein